jgi:hypothetical protein
MRVLCDRCMPDWRVESGERITVSGPARLRELRDAGLDPAHGPETEASRRATQRAHREADASWDRRHGPVEPGHPADPDRWQRLQPRLTGIPVARLREVTGYSLRHCSRFRAGLVVPHPRVWAALEGEAKAKAGGEAQRGDPDRAEAPGWRLRGGGRP